MLTEVMKMHKENFNWLSLLEYYNQENTVQKNMLAAVVEGRTDSSDLEKAEYFQSEFLKKDEIINILRCDIFRQEELLSLNHNGAGETLGEVILKKQESLRRSMHFLETEIAALKVTFERYLISAEKPN